ncbi:ABC transporter ATP-binding protein [Erysipelotrichaceae bacterium OH741_COT-311]|nr:ABC transporter ATP-binding protein [Erysipelotrichaceae bacterium OH741_COT-311]
MNRSGFKVMRSLISLVYPLLHVMVLAITTGVLGFLLATFITILGAFAIANILGYDMGLSLNTILLWIGLCAIFRGVLRYIEQLSNHYIAFKILALLRNIVFKVLRNLAPAKLDGKDSGDLIALITSDIELLEVFYAHTISPIAIGFLTSLIMVIFIMHYSFYVGIIAMFAYITVGYIIPVTLYKYGQKEGLQYRKEFADLNNYFLDNLRGLQEIMQYDAQEYRKEFVMHKTNQLHSNQELLKKYEGITRGITNVAVVFFSMLGLFVNAYLYQKTSFGLHLALNFPQALISTVALMSSFGPVLALSSLSGNLRYTLASGNRLLDLLQEESVVEEVVDGKKVEMGDVCLHQVSFAYQKEEPILKDYSLKVEKNKIIGICGKSGSGKSTILKLMMRFYDPHKGMLTLNDVNLKEISTSHLRDLQSYVIQDTHLFNDTILNNITLGKDIPLEKVQQACKKASIDNFIEALPEGYDSQVAELGSSLSSGERQRIGLARAFLYDSPMILLDEPTSNLDSLNEGIILKALKEESKNKTVVLVSHRQSTMNIADQSYQIDTIRKS